MISLAFISPVSARESGMLDVVNAIEHLEGVAYDDDFQLYIEQLLNDEELIMLMEAISCTEDNAQLENLLQEFNMVLESNPAYIDLMNYIDNVYGEDIAILQAFSQQATEEDMHNVINSVVVSPDGTFAGDSAPADFSATHEDSSSGFSAPEGEENTGIIPVIDPIDPTDPIYVGDLYPVYAPFIGIKDTSYNCILQGGEASVYIPGYGTIPLDLFDVSVEWIILVLLVFMLWWTALTEWIWAPVGIPVWAAFLVSIICSTPFFIMLIWLLRHPG